MNRHVIAAKYRKLGLRKGWTFLACPEARLRDAEVAIVGTNPGGGGPKDAYAYSETWSCEDGNAFYSELSEHQSQVQAWHRLMDVNPDQTLCAQFIPFRSPDLARLERRKEAIAFAEELWSWVLSHSPAKLFVTMGSAPALHLGRLLGAGVVASNLPTGWGTTTIDVYESGSGHRIVRMPHPSRYKLMGRGSIAEESFCAAVGRPQLQAVRS